MPMRRVSAWRVVTFVLLMLAVFCLSASQVLAAEGEGGTTKEDPGTFGWIAHLTVVGYIVLTLILGLSVMLVMMIVWMLLDLRGSNMMPVDFLEAFEEALTKKKFKEAFELAKSEPTMVGRVMTAGMTRLQHGLQEGRDAAAAMVDSLKTRKDHVISYMATVGTLGPLFGLVGTVSGMISSFGVLGRGGTPNPSDLAMGISEALWMTLMGISLSLPAIFFYSFFRNRNARIAIDVHLLADDLLTQMFHTSRAAAAGTAPAAAPKPAVSKSSPDV